MLSCTSDKNGKWKNHVVIRKTLVNSGNEDSSSDDSEIKSDDSEIEEFEYDESSSFDDDEEDINLEDTTQGEYVLYKFTENKYYVAAVIENTSEKVLLRCARKYGITGKKITLHLLTWID